MTTVRRLTAGPIITPDSHPSVGDNINGPSLVRVPDWVEGRLGTYYLYFAHHKGDHIRLAVADELAGPWRVRPGGVLDLFESRFLIEPPEATDDEVAAIEALYEEAFGDYVPPNGLLEDLTHPHIASPDVRINHDYRVFSMYLHGLDALGVQVTRHATSTDGLHFEVDPLPIDGTYLRAFTHRLTEYALTMPGTLRRRRAGPTDFETGPTLLPKSARHSAVSVDETADRISIYWTNVGDAPERILRSDIDASVPWTQWTASDPVEILRPELPWEGADEPLEASRRSLAPGFVNQLRDPDIHLEDGRTYLVYAIGGESGLAIVELIEG